MAYPATALGFALPYVIAFDIGLLPVHAGWIAPDAFWHAAMLALKYTIAATGIIGSLWALKDYHSDDPSPYRHA